MCVAYDVNLVKDNIRKFKSKRYKSDEITICFDMDNTLCLFSPFGNIEQAMKNMHKKGFYKNLTCFPEARNVIETLQKYGFNVKILSACIDSPYCKKEKLEWINTYLPSVKEEDIILVEVGENKADYIKNPNSTILVDDYHKNIQDFYEAGGIAVKKTYSGKCRPIPQVKSLNDIFNILSDLIVIEDSKK